MVKKALPGAIVLALALAVPAGAQQVISGSGPRDFDSRTKHAVRLGLAYLALHQNGDGSWNDRVGYSFRGSFYGDDVKSVYATSLAGMALAAGRNSTRFSMPTISKHGSSLCRPGRTMSARPTGRRTPI